MAVSTSDNYNKIISLPGGKKFHSGAHVDFADGRSIEIDDRNIMQGYPSIQDKVSEESVFELGGAYSALLTLKLNNFENEFKDYNFKGAVVKPWIGLTTAVHWRDGEIIEKIPKGVFTITEAPEANSIISVTAYDNLVKMDVKYADKSTLAYPAALAQIAADACSVCGVNLATAAFPNSDYVVAKRPDSNTITCREVLQYAAQLAGCFAKCNKDGDVEIRWYETPAYVFDIGKNAKTVSVAQNDTTITGVQIQGNDDSKTVYTVGTNDYAVRIQDNPLAQDGLQGLANSLGTQLIGTHFSAYSASAPMNPAIETGDIVYLADNKGNQYTTIVSGLQIEFGDYEQFSGDAESTDENQSERFDKADKAQESADEANAGVEEAKTEITQLNGQIVLKADKGSLIAEINISPETIKISASKLELSGLVTITNLANGTTTIDGACIRTGRIESEDGKWWLDLATGQVFMSDGVFAGDIQWDENSFIKHNGEDTAIYSGGTLTLQAGNSDPNKYVDIPNYCHIHYIDAEYMDLNGNSVDYYIDKMASQGYTGNYNLQMADGSSHRFYFSNGLLTGVS